MCVSVTASLLRGNSPFLGMFAKLQKVTVSFVRSVCACMCACAHVCMHACMHACLPAWNNLAPNGQIFMKFYI
jgi:hypothetical protein